MKRTIPLLLLSFLLTASLYSQTLQYELNVNYTRNASGMAADITVTVRSGDPEFTFLLMTNDPVNGEVLLKSEPTRKNSYVFRNIKPGKYFIKIEDGTGKQAGKTVTIKENEN